MGTLTLISESANGVLTNPRKHGTQFPAGSVIGLFPLILTYAGDTYTLEGILTNTSENAGVLTTINKN